ncbi:MAG: hypothetical protein RRB13_07605 [bacterium]|nr:hypothetical protein [bacterium]
MLHFQGIRTNRQGVPERYSVRYDLMASLEALLVIIEHHQGDAEAVMASIDASLNDHFRHSAPLGNARGEHRRATAQWFRARDMAQFLFKEPALRRLKLNSLRLLLEPRPLEDKWQLIKESLVQGIQELEPQFAHALLLEPDSDLHRLLETLGLFFLDQDPELPPMNLEMEFLRGDFPKRIWRRKGNLSPSPSPFWQPQNRLCDALVLEQLVLEQLFEERVHQALSHAYEPEGTITQNTGPISLRFEEEGQTLELIPQSPAETLLLLQREVQRQHSFEGSKHLLALMRQLAEAQSPQFRFDKKSHFELLGRLKQGQEISLRQQQLLDDVLAAMSRVKVRRQQTLETIETPLLMRWAEIESPQGPGAIELLLDPILYHGLGLGQQLRLIPREVFLESTQSHGLIPGLMAYLTGWWLVQYPERKGVFNCRADKLIEAFTLKKSATQKAKFQAKIKSELKYMAEKKYIGAFEVSPHANPFEEEYQITAPLALLETLRPVGPAALNA